MVDDVLRLVAALEVVNHLRQLRLAGEVRADTAVAIVCDAAKVAVLDADALQGALAELVWSTSEFARNAEGSRIRCGRWVRLSLGHVLEFRALELPRLLLAARLFASMLASAIRLCQLLYCVDGVVACWIAFWLFLAGGSGLEIGVVDVAGSNVDLVADNIGSVVNRLRMLVEPKDCTKI